MSIASPGVILARARRPREPQWPQRGKGKDWWNRNFTPLTCVLARLKKIPKLPSFFFLGLVHSKPLPTFQIPSSRPRTDSPIRLWTSVRINTSSPGRFASAPTAQAEAAEGNRAPSDQTHARLDTPHCARLLFLCMMSAPTSPLTPPPPNSHTHEHAHRPLSGHR